MNSSFLVKNRTLLAVAAMLFAELLLPLPGLSAEDKFSAQAKNLWASFQTTANGQSANADKLKQEIIDLQGKATPLDDLQNQLAPVQIKIDGLEADYKNASARFDALNKQLENLMEVAKAQLSTFPQKAGNLCSQMGGAMQGGDTCTFTCPENNTAPCQQKISSFNAQIEPLKSQLLSVVGQMKTKQEEVDAAQAKADAKRQEWEAKKAQLADQKRDFDRRRNEFDEEARRIAAEIGNSNHAPRQPNLGPAAQDLNNVHSDHGGGGGGRSHYDNGHLPNAAIPLLGAPPAVPDAVAKSPAYIQANAKSVEAVRKATERADAADQELRKAEANHADSQELQLRLKNYADANRDKIIEIYKSKTNFPDLFNGVLPKPAN